MRGSDKMSNKSQKSNYSAQKYQKVRRLCPTIRYSWNRGLQHTHAPPQLSHCHCKFQYFKLQTSNFSLVTSIAYTYWNCLSFKARGMWGRESYKHVLVRLKWNFSSQRFQCFVRYETIFYGFENFKVWIFERSCFLIVKLQKKLPLKWLIQWYKIKSTCM